MFTLCGVGRVGAALSQAELARKAKVSQPMVARLERGDQERIPTIDTIHRILKILGYQLVLDVKLMDAA